MLVDFGGKIHGFRHDPIGKGCRYHPRVEAVSLKLTLRMSEGGRKSGILLGLGKITREVGRMGFWKCPACGFDAQNEKQKQEHMTRTVNDPKHAKPPQGTGQTWAPKSPATPTPWQQGGKGQGQQKG